MDSSAAIYLAGHSLHILTPRLKAPVALVHNIRKYSEASCGTTKMTKVLNENICVLLAAAPEIFVRNYQIVNYVQTTFGFVGDCCDVFAATWSR
jgi:hypothetical protein